MISKIQLFGILFLATFFSFSLSASGQENSSESLKANKENIGTNIKYRRSSIFSLMVDVKGRVYGDTIKKAFITAPVPDKFNDHNLTARTFNPEEYNVDAATVAQSNGGKKGIGSSLLGAGKSLLGSATAGLVDTSDVQNLKLRIDKYIKENGLAREMVAKWFNRDQNGAFNMDLVAQRGFYDATEMQTNVAKASARGIGALADAGEELIGNTFLIVTSFKYVDKAQVAENLTTGLSILKQYGGSTLGTVADVASVGATVAGKGYVVKSNTYLYKLVWNDSTAAVFYDKLWMDKKTLDKDRRNAFDTTSLFKLEYVGCESAWADVQSTLFSHKQNDELTRIATVRAVDAVISKLQKRYEVFRTKTPLYTTDPLSAKIGLKEGLSKGDKFEVLEQTLDEKTGKTIYVRKGVVKVDKNQIWDNRYVPTEDGAIQTVAASENVTNPTTDRTYFSGGKGYYPGMLLRQIK